MLTALASDLWGAETDLFLPGRLHFRCRMTVVRLPTGEVLLHSPIPVDPPLAAAIDGLGPVRHLVAPNNLHHLFLGEAQARWPGATTWAAPGLPDKRPDLRIDRVLGRDRAAWEDTLVPHFIEGIPWMAEHTFEHPASRTLLVTDLLFHFHAGDVANWGSRTFFRLLGVLDRAKQSPLLRLQTRDRAAAARSCHALLGLELDRVVPAHGRVVEGEIRATLTSALSWMLAGAVPALPQTG
jgi:hypothetical protein